MRTLFTSVSVLSLCLSSLLLAGCETNDCKTEEGKDGVCAESLDEFLGDEQTLSEAYTAGQNVTISGIYGDITVIGGDAGVVSAAFQPFNWRGHGQEDDARRELEDNLDLAVTTEGDDITVSSGRHDSKNGLGSHITVALPPEFDGVLIVKNDGDGPINQGNIDVSYAGQATTLNVVNHGLENCNIMRDANDNPIENSLTTADVRCEADISVLGVRDNVVVKSINPAFHSNVRVQIVSISADATGGEITGDDSTIELLVPAEGDFNVSAGASGPRAHMGDVELGSCEATAEDETSLELACGAGGPVYLVSAEDNDADDDDDSFINVIVQ